MAALHHSPAQMQLQGETAEKKNASPTDQPTDPERGGFALACLRSAAGRFMNSSFALQLHLSLRTRSRHAAMLKTAAQTVPRRAAGPNTETHGTFAIFVTDRSHLRYFGQRMVTKDIG